MWVVCVGGRAPYVRTHPCDCVWSMPLISLGQTMFARSSVSVTVPTAPSQTDSVAHASREVLLGLRTLWVFYLFHFYSRRCPRVDMLSISSCTRESFSDTTSSKQAWRGPASPLRPHSLPCFSVAVLCRSLNGKQMFLAT